MEAAVKRIEDFLVSACEGVGVVFFHGGAVRKDWAAIITWFVLGGDYLWKCCHFVPINYSTCSVRFIAEPGVNYCFRSPHIDSGDDVAVNDFSCSWPNIVLGKKMGSSASVQRPIVFVVFIAKNHGKEYVFVSFDT